MTFIVQSYLDTFLHYVLSVTFCEAVVLKDNREVQKGYKVRRTVYFINTWRVCQTRVHKSLIGNLARHSFSLFDRNKTQPQTSNTSEQWLVYHEQNDGRLQKFTDNQILC